MKVAVAQVPQSSPFWAEMLETWSKLYRASFRYFDEIDAATEELNDISGTYSSETAEKTTKLLAEQSRRLCFYNNDLESIVGDFALTLLGKVKMVYGWGKTMMDNSEPAATPLPRLMEPALAEVSNAFPLDPVVSDMVDIVGSALREASHGHQLDIYKEAC